MSTPKWAVGMRRLGPGMYIDRNNALHFRALELCESYGIAPTPENLRLMEEAMVEAIQDLYGPDLPVEFAVDRAPAGNGKENRA